MIGSGFAVLLTVLIGAGIILLMMIWNMLRDIFEEVQMIKLMKAKHGIFSKAKTIDEPSAHPDDDELLSDEVLPGRIGSLSAYKIRRAESEMLKKVSEQSTSNALKIEELEKRINQIQGMVNDIYIEE